MRFVKAAWARGRRQEDRLSAGAVEPDGTNSPHAGSIRDSTPAAPAVSWFRPLEESPGGLRDRPSRADLSVPESAKLFGISRAHAYELVAKVLSIRRSEQLGSARFTRAMPYLVS